MAAAAQAPLSEGPVATGNAAGTPHLNLALPSEVFLRLLQGLLRRQLVALLRRGALLRAGRAHKRGRGRAAAVGGVVLVLLLEELQRVADVPHAPGGDRCGAGGQKVGDESAVGAAARVAAEESRRGGRGGRAVILTCVGE